MEHEKWKPFRLDQLGFVGRGRSRSRPRNNPDLYGGSYPLFETGDIKSVDLYLSEPKKTYNDKGLAQSKLWNPGTLCITIAANIAETAILKTKACFPDSVVGFVANPEKADVRYVKYYIDIIKLQMQNISQGTTQDNLSVEKLLSFDFFAPPLPIQRKIASILSAYDDLIENNTHRIKILEDMTATIYRQWFVEFRFPGHENVPMVDSELGLIPQGWDVAKISDIADLSRKGITPTKFPEEIFAHFSIPAFDSGCMPSIDSGDTIRSNKYLVTENCVLVSKLNPHIPRVWLPFLNIIHRAIASTEFLILKPRPPVDCVFLFNFCRSTEFSGKIAVRALGTSRSHQRVIPSDFLGLSVLLPTKSLLNSFREKVSPMLNICNNLRLKNTNLRQTRDLLLPKLISGEIDVSELDIDTEGIQPRKGIIHIPPSLSDWLHSDQKILGGKPIIRGTRLAVEFILDLLENGWSAEEIIENYPSIGTGDIAACLAYQQKATDVSVGG